MKPVTLLVLANPATRALRLLERLPEQTNIAVGETPEAFENLAAEAEVVLIVPGLGEVLRQLWPRLTRLRWVHSGAAGVDRILFPGLVASPVPLTNGRGVFAPSLGEFAAAAILFFAKKLRAMISAQQAGRWAAELEVEWVRGKTVGIVGYGAIGRAVAACLHPFGMRIVAQRRNVSGNPADPLISRMYGTSELEQMLPECDYVVVAAPLTDSTRGMIGARALALLRPEAVLINVGRGPVVDEAALIPVLEQRRIRGAALDVFGQEPLPEGHPFYKLDNVLLSPHAADHTPGWEEMAIEFFLENFERFQNGLPLENLVDKQRGY